MHTYQFIRKSSYTIPLLYFTMLVLWMYFSGLFNARESEPLVLLCSIPFLLQLWFRNRMFSVVLGMLMLLWSGWMLLAYASEYSEIARASLFINPSFIVIGGGFVFLNFAMAIWLFPAEMGKARQGQHYQL